MSADDRDWMRPPFDPIALAEGFTAWPTFEEPPESYEVSYERRVMSETVDGVTAHYGPPPPQIGENPGKPTRGHLTSKFKEATEAQRAAERMERRLSADAIYGVLPRADDPPPARLVADPLLLSPGIPPGRTERVPKR